MEACIERFSDGKIVRSPSLFYNFATLSRNDIYCAADTSDIHIDRSLQL